MNLKKLAALLGNLLMLLSLSSTTLAETPMDQGASAAIPIRVGWQIPTVTQAALVQVLKRTDVLARHGLEPSLLPYSYGTPEVEAALAGKLDAFFAGDQPTINLLARGGKWKIVARVYTDRVTVIVPPKSSIRNISDLEGKSLASPFGSIAHREAILEQQRAGLDPEQDVTNYNRDILEIRNLVLGGGMEQWQYLDAASVWEPDASSFELEGVTRSLSDTQALGVLAMSDEFISAHPQAAVEFLVAITRAWDFFVGHTERVLQWYIDDTHLGYAPQVLDKAVRIDPNFTAASPREIDLQLTEAHIATLATNAAWGVEAWQDGSEIRAFIDKNLLAQAREVVAATTEFEELDVILPSVRELDLEKERETHGVDALPLWGAFLFMVLVALLAIETGFWFGKRHQSVADGQSDPSIGTVVGAVLGMMAFVIALTFGSASARFDARKAALLEDVTAIQTAYLRADLLPEPQRTTIRSLLRDYIQVRVGIVYAYGQPERLALIQRRAEALQEAMWLRVEELSEDNGGGRIQVFFASTLNDMFKLHTKRVVLGAYYRIPDFVWWILLSASGVAMIAVGFQFGSGKGRRIHVANFSLAITFALVMLLAFDLDRAGEGLVTVNQQPMIDLYRGVSAGD